MLHMMWVVYHCSVEIDSFDTAIFLSWRHQYVTGTRRPGWCPICTGTCVSICLKTRDSLMKCCRNLKEKVEQVSISPQAIFCSNKYLNRWLLHWIALLGKRCRPIQNTLIIFGGTPVLLYWNTAWGKSLHFSVKRLVTYIDDMAPGAVRGFSRVAR